MTSDLHGGGIPFVSNFTISDIASGGQDMARLDYTSPVQFQGKPATLWLLRTDDSTEDGRSDYEIQFDAPARAVLGLPDGDQPADSQNSDPGSDISMLMTSSPKIYDKIVDATTTHVPLSNTLLKKIAKNMHSGSATEGSSGIAAMYTYFGQFIAHDLTHMKPIGSPATAWNHRTSAFDLDSLFDDLPPGVTPDSALQCLTGFPAHHLCIGLTSKDRHEDLPRTSTGTPCITDRRNDNNLAVSQLFVAITRFIHRLQIVKSYASISGLQLEASRYLQSIILTDYLPAVCDHLVLFDIENSGSKVVVLPGGDPSAFHIPTEFAAGCFRFGHSMVNSEYQWSEKKTDPELAQLLNFTHLGNGIGENTSNGRLVDSWVIDWDRFNGPQGVAKSIDTNLSYSLGKLYPNWIDNSSGVPFNAMGYDLAFITLWRANQLKMANAQQLLAWVNATGAVTTAPAGGAVLFEHDVDHLCTGLDKNDCDALNDNTPIWLYILREAELSGTGKLGSLGSRIVAETIIATIKAAPGNIITGNPLIVANEFNAANPDKFSLNDLIAAQGADI